MKGVSEAIGKHVTEDSKGIKAHFRMDESGLLNLENVEAVFETKVESEAEEVGNIVGDAISKFGESISKLFGGKDEETVVEKVFTISLLCFKKLTFISIQGQRHRTQQRDCQSKRVQK